MIDIGIIGGSGYTGGELIRLLLQHPKAKIRTVTSRRLAGTPVTDVHRHLSGLTDLAFVDPPLSGIASACEVVFTAVPHGAAMDIVPELLTCGTRVIDLSADYRLPQQVFEDTYKRPHTDPRDGGAVFGLPELHGGISEADLVANPGCYPTGAILSAAPLASEGPSATSHYPNLAENVRAYNITTHRHLPEIVQELSRLDRSLNNIYLTPHVVPAIRGILTTAHLILSRELDYDAVLGLYNEFYRDKPFVRVRDDIPDLSDVRGSNFCDIGIACGGRRVVVVSAIDNLVKGASGQAVQNMNLMFGLPETAGLLTPPLSP